MKTQFTLGSFAISFNEKKEILLCHRKDYDLWNLPGGGIQEQENPIECVLREVKEETGLEVEVLKLIGIYSKENENDIVFSFMCKILGGVITLNDEADKIEYFEIDEIPKNTVPKQVERIKDAVLDSEKIIFKTQTGKSSLQLMKEGKL